MLENTRRSFLDKCNPFLFTNTTQQINRICIKSLFEPSTSIRLKIEAFLGEISNGSLEIIECESYDKL
jgi:hypothetical protein